MIKSKQGLVGPDREFFIRLSGSYVGEAIVATNCVVADACMSIFIFSGDLIASSASLTVACFTLRCILPCKHRMTKDASTRAARMTLQFLTPK